MTNPSIPPCPVCGKMPKLANQQLHLGIIIPRCVCITFAAIDSAMWQERCMYEMHNALHELGIETVEQLKAKMQPDPRVAVLDRLGLLTLDQIEAVLVCAKAAVRASKTEGGIIITEDVTAVIDSIIAAQRGEVEG